MQQISEKKVFTFRCDSCCFRYSCCWHLRQFGCF